MGIVLTEGLGSQLASLAAQGDTTPSLWRLLLSADTPAWSESTSLGSVSIAVVGGVSCDTPWGGMTVTGESDGQATAQLGIVDYGLGANGGDVTITQWMLWAPLSGYGLWAGSFSPPFTPTTAFPSTIRVQDITVTLGSCPASPPSPTVLLSDSFAGSGSVPLGSHSPLIGGPWTVLARPIAAGNGQCSAQGSGNVHAAAPQGSESVTITAAYIEGSSILTDRVLLYAYGSTSTTFVSVTAGTSQVYLTFSAGGSSSNSSIYSLSVTAGDTYTLALRINDGVALGYFDGALVVASGPFFFDVSDSVGLGFDPLFGAGTSVFLSLTATTP